jgi:hypothetical protein
MVEKRCVGSSYLLLVVVAFVIIPRTLKKFLPSSCAPWGAQEGRNFFNVSVLIILASGILAPVEGLFSELGQTFTKKQVIDLSIPRPISSNVTTTSSTLNLLLGP